MSENQATGQEILLLLSPRAQDTAIRVRMEEYMTSRGLMCGSHDSHGLYYDVFAGHQKFMFDLSPDDEPRPRPIGLLVVRDRYYSWDNPTKPLGRAVIFDGDAFDRIDKIIGVGR